MTIQFLKLAALVIPAACLADTTLDYDSSKNPEVVMSIQIKDGDVLMGGKTSKALYKAGSREIVVIDHNRRTYMIIDDAAAQRMNEQMKAMQDQMKAMMAQMQEQMAEMTPAQRAALEKAMKQRMPEMGDPNARISVERGGKGSASGIACQNIVVKTGNVPAHEACVASAQALGISPEDYRSMLSAMDAMQEIMRKMNAGTNALPVNVRQLDGIPIRMKNLRDGDTSALTGRSNAPLDAGLFQVPSGYNERTLLQ